MRNIILLGLTTLFTNALFAQKSWYVGSSRQYKACSEVSGLVNDGDSIFIDGGNYINDIQVRWGKNNLFIKGINGTPILKAGDKIANDQSNGKGIFVLAGNTITVENIQFENAKVVDNNGAGIRQEGNNPVIRNCKFYNNQMGILYGGTHIGSNMLIEYCEFSGGGIGGGGYAHNVYINNIDTLTFRYNNSFNSVNQGHEFKSRARVNFILYNRIANENTEDSRTIDIPNGGVSVLIGNVIEQGPTSANTNIIGYGLEGLSNAGPHAVYFVNNTIVNKRNSGSFIHLQQGTDSLYMRNNVLAGAVTAGYILNLPKNLDTAFNLKQTDITAFKFLNSNNFDYHLTKDSPCIDAGTTSLKSLNSFSLMPNQEYTYLNKVKKNIQNKIDIGAFEYINPTQTDETLNLPNPLICFPTPVSDILTIKNGLGNEYMLYNNIGVPLELKTNENQSVNLEHLPKGVYILIDKKDGRSCPIVKF